MMRLHVLPPSPRAIKVVAARNFLGIECDARPVDYASAEQRSAEFARLNPNRRQPVLEDGDWILWESNAILFYFAAIKPEKGLWPGAPRARAEVMRWLSWESSHWDPACDMLITERLKKRFFVTSESGRRTAGRATAPEPPDPARLAEGERYVRELAAVLDAHLGSRSWLVAEKPTIADFALGAWMPSRDRAGLPIQDFDAIARWYDRVEDLPGWREALTPPPAGPAVPAG
jgi:glutathione S-transferase